MAEIGSTSSIGMGGGLGVELFFQQIRRMHGTPAVGWTMVAGELDVQRLI